MRLSILAPALSVVTLAAPAALAQDAGTGSLDPVAAVRGFLTDADLFGADTATVGSVTAEGDTVIATDVSMRWQTAFEAAEETVTLTAAASIDRVSVTNLQRTDSGYGAGEIVIPLVNISISAEGASESLNYDFRVTDYRMVDAEWNPFPVIAADPERPASRFAPLVDWAVHQSYALNEVGAIRGVVITSDGQQEISYGPLSIGPVVDGALESFQYGPVETTQDMEVPGEDGEMRMETVTIRYGASSGTIIDAKPIAALLTGTGAQGGPQTVIGSLVVDSTDVEAGDVFSLSIGPNRTENLTIDPSKGPLLEKIDPLVLAALADEEPSPDVIIELLLDVYGAFGIGTYSLADIEVAGQDFSAELGEILLEGLSSAGLDLMAFRGLSVNTPDGSSTMGAFEVADVVFPDRAAFMSTVMSGAMGMEPGVREILDATPYLGRITLSGFEVTAPDIGTVSLGLFETRLDGHVAPIPTSVAIDLEGLSVPSSAMPDQETAMMLQALGADPLTADGTIGLAWNEGTSDMTMDVDLTVGGVGNITAEAALAGIPRIIFEDPMRAQEAFATAAIDTLTLTFGDAGLTDFILGMMSEETGLTREEFIEGISAQIQMQGAMMLGAPQLAETVSQAVADFLSNPQSLSVALDPAAPVALAQIMGAAMTAPQALPELLNFSINANQ